MVSRSDRRAQRRGLRWCLTELSWLEKAQEDDSVGDLEWRERGNALFAAAAQLRGRDQDRFHVEWEAFQQRESARTGVPVPALPDAVVGYSLEQEEADRIAADRIAALLREHTKTSTDQLPG